MINETIWSFKSDEFVKLIRLHCKQSKDLKTFELIWFVEVKVYAKLCGSFA